MVATPSPRAGPQAWRPSSPGALLSPRLAFPPGFSVPLWTPHPWQSSVLALSLSSSPGRHRRQPSWACPACRDPRAPTEGTVAAGRIDSVALGPPSSLLPSECGAAPGWLPSPRPSCSWPRGGRTLGVPSCPPLPAPTPPAPIQHAPSGIVRSQACSAPSAPEIISLWADKLAGPLHRPSPSPRDTVTGNFRLDAVGPQGMLGWPRSRPTTRSLCAQRPKLLHCSCTGAKEQAAVPGGGAGADLQRRDHTEARALSWV